MNEKFFSLPEAKQQAIINAGYRVFSQNSYKNSPMSEIAESAGISKSLLFHYFHNKKDLYLFLWEKCAEISIEYMARYDCYGQTLLFDAMERGMRAKMEIIRRYPDEEHPHGDVTLSLHRYDDYEYKCKLNDGAEYHSANADDYDYRSVFLSHKEEYFERCHADCDDKISSPIETYDIHLVDPEIVEFCD